MIDNKKILLGISSGIAAFKAIDVLRLLKNRGADVRVVMTPNAHHFVAPMTLSVLSGYPVRTEMFSSEDEMMMGHIELAKWADCILIVPASADFIAKVSHGHADNLLTTLWLACNKKKIIAPAMNQVMWGAEVTQQNIQLLKQQGIYLLGPDSGLQACGDNGEGRLLEPEPIVSQLEALLLEKTADDRLEKFQGINIVITAGPTREPLDPVRYISNHSSGKMGYALAESALKSGAKVTLVSGPVDREKLLTPAMISPNIEILNVQTAREMYNEVKALLPETNIFIACAAVADYRAETTSQYKIKKSDSHLQLNLVKNPDIVKMVSASEYNIFTVGFAAETDKLEENAEKKLIEKKLHLLVANQVGLNSDGVQVGFNSDENEVTLFSPLEQKKFIRMGKKQLADLLIEEIVKQYNLCKQ